jgi:hypothetical protein
MYFKQLQAICRIRPGVNVTRCRCHIDGSGLWSLEELGGNGEQEQAGHEDCDRHSLCIGLDIMLVLSSR